MSAIFRTVAYAAWALAFGLSVWLAVEFHEYKFGISLGVAILALILSAFGLVMARFCGKDRVAMAIGIVLWAAGAISFAITELGYWSSSYKDRHAQYMQVKEAKARQEGMKDLAWEALRTGEARATTAELEARIKAARQHDRWSSSIGCTNATAKESREFCQGYFELEAKLASAGNLEAMETRLFANGTSSAKDDIIHNVFAAADLVAENTSLSEREAATLVILTIALVLMLSRDLLLIVANPVGGATAASGRAEVSEATETPAAVSPPVTASPAPLPARYERKPIVPMIELPEFGAQKAELALSEVTVPTSGTDPDGSGSPAAKPEDPVEEVAEPVRNVVSLFRDDGKGPEAQRAKKKSHKPEAKVESWLSESTTQVDDPNVKVGSEACWRSYLAYCEATDKQPIGRKLFSRKLGVLLGRKTGNGRKRDAKGSVFSGLMINQAVNNHSAKRKVA